MKLTKRQLKNLIIESLLNEQEGGKFLGFDEVEKHPKALKFKTPFPAPAKEMFDRLKRALSAAKLDPENYYLAKEYYDTYISTGKPGTFGATGPSLGISGKGDPYTYKPLSSGKVLVVSGPNPKAVGKTFTPKKKIKQDEPEVMAADKPIEFIIVKNFQDFGDKIRGMADKFGLPKSYSTTSNNKVVREPAAKDAVKQSKAGNIGMADVKDALIEVAKGRGLEVLVTGFSSDTSKNFEIFIAYRSKDMPDTVTIEQTGQFKTTSSGEDSYVAPDSSDNQGTQQITESRGSLYRRRYYGRY